MKIKKFVKNAFIFLFSVFFIILTGCNPNEQTDNLLITSISPDSVLANTPFTLTVHGEGFNSDSVIVAGGAAVETTFESSEQLRGNIGASLTSIALDSESDNIYIQVEQPKDASSYETSMSNAIYLEVRHIPRCGDPALIHSGGGTRGKDSIMFVTNDSPRLVVYWCDWEVPSLQAQQQNPDERASEGKSEPPVYYYKVIVSEDNGNTWSAAKDAPHLNNMIAYEGKLFGWYAGLSYNPDTLFYRSDNMGDTWAIIGTFSPPPLGKNEHICTMVTADKNGKLILVNAVRDEDYLMTLRTYSSMDYGATWTGVGEQVFDISYIYTSVWPSLLLVNNVGGIRFELSYYYGRYAAGAGFISRDGGLTYEDASGAYDIYGGQFLLTDQEELVMLQNVMYLPYMTKLYFNIAYDLGTVSGIWYPLDELITETEGSGYSIMKGENGHIYVQQGNRMVRSYDYGINWSVPSTFLNSFSSGEVFVRKGEDNTFYVLIKDDSYDLYFCSSAASGS